jgi:hypothetical protein
MACQRAAVLSDDFQSEGAGGFLLRQPVGEHAARTSGTDDDVVE